MKIKSGKTLKTVLAVFTALICIFIWSNSLTGAEASKQISGEVAEAVSGAFSGEDGLPKTAGFIVSHIRKFAHVAEFMILGFVLYLDIRCGKAELLKPAVKALLIAFIVAFTDESIQMFIPGRSAEIGDVWIDLSGAAAGIAIAVIAAFIKKAVSGKNSK